MGKRLVEIEVVCKDGSVKIEGKGFQGDECVKETKDLEEALGKVESRHMKPEANQKQKVTDQTKLKH